MGGPPSRLCPGASCVWSARSLLRGGVKRLVLLAPLLVIRQNFVGLLYLLEALLGSRVLGVDIRMVLADKLTMRSLDVVLGSLFGHPEQLIQIHIHVHSKTCFE